MSNKLVVAAKWDGEADVWVALSDDIPGLATEARTLDALLERVLAVAPELLEDNAAFLVRPHAEGDTVDLHILAPFALEQGAAAE
jgi:predicted RNase H-like HicB family nuclease